MKRILWPFVLLLTMTCYGQGLLVEDLTTTDDVTVGDDLIVTDDASVGGDMVITGSLTAGSIVGSAATAINDIGDAAGNGTIAQTGYKQIWTSTLNTAGAMWTFANTTADLTADVSFLDLKYTDDGDANGFFARGYDNTSDLKWSIGNNGAFSMGALTATTGTFSDLLTASAGWDLQGVGTIGDGTASVAINTSSWDISSAGVLSGLTGLTFTDDLTLANGKALNCATTTSGHVIYLDVYDNDTGPAWVHGLTLTNGNTPAVAIGNGAMNVSVDSGTWDVSTAGAFTGVTGLTLITGSALTVGAVQWDNGADYIDGEMIAADSIDDDSIDFADVTGADLTLNDITTAVKTTSTFECDGAANISDTTAGADVLMGNSTGNLAFISDNADITLTDTTDNAFQIVNSNTAVLLDIDLGAADAITLGSGAETVAINSSDWDISVTGAMTGVASVTFDSNTGIYHASVEISNGGILALRGSPVPIVSAGGANTIVELVSAVLILDYGSEVLTETADNLVIEYITSGVDATAAIEATGFIDAAADTIAFIPAVAIPTVAAADVVNKGLQLFNTGDGEYAGNASNDTTMTVKVAYRIHADGL